MKYKLLIWSWAFMFLPLAHGEVVGDVTIAATVERVDKNEVVVKNADGQRVSFQRSEIKNRRVTAGEVNDLIISGDHLERVEASILDSGF